MPSADQSCTHCIARVVTSVPQDLQAVGHNQQQLARWLSNCVQKSEPAKAKAPKRHAPSTAASKTTEAAHYIHTQRCTNIHTQNVALNKATQAEALRSAQHCPSCIRCHTKYISTTANCLCCSVVGASLHACSCQVCCPQLCQPCDIGHDLSRHSAAQLRHLQDSKQGTRHNSANVSTGHKLSPGSLLLLMPTSSIASGPDKSTTAHSTSICFERGSYQPSSSSMPTPHPPVLPVRRSRLPSCQ